MVYSAPQMCHWRGLRSTWTYIQLSVYPHIILLASTNMANGSKERQTSNRTRVSLKDDYETGGPRCCSKD
jgi:hypothetical protein